jgi:hypothetical protein
LAIEAASERAPAAALEALEHEWSTRIAKFRVTLEQIGQLVLDEPFLPSSLLQPSIRGPRATSLGLSLWRTSLGLGRKNLGEKPVSYYINANHQGQASDAQGLESGWLEQNERLREDVYRSTIYASLAAMLVIALGVLGPYLFRPLKPAVLVWPVLCVVFLWRVMANLRTARSSATDLCALESCLWQYAINGFAATPKRLLVTQSGPTAKRKRRGQLLLLAGSVAMAAMAVTTIYWGTMGTGRWYSVPYARLSLPEKFSLTKDNVAAVVDLQSSFLRVAPRLRTGDQLIGAVVPAGCLGADKSQEGIFGDLVVYDPADPQHAYKPCEPVINWRGRSDDKQQVVTLDVRFPPPDEIKPGELVLPPPTISYNSNKPTPTLGAITVTPPSVTLDPNAPMPTLGTVTVAPPTIAYDPNKEMPNLPEIKFTASKVTLATDNFDIAAGSGAGKLPSTGSSGLTEPPANSLKNLATKPDDNPQDGFNSETPSKGMQWPGISAPPSLGISLWFKANCPQRSDTTKGLAGENSASRRCDTSAGTIGLNVPLNSYLQVSPLRAIDYLKSKASNHIVRFVIIGHADTPGDPAFNLALSEDRVAYAMDLFTAAGIDQSRVRGFAAGGDFPWLPQQYQQRSGEPQELNRRVDIYVFGE